VFLLPNVVEFFFAKQKPRSASCFDAHTLLGVEQTGRRETHHDAAIEGGKAVVPKPRVRGDDKTKNTEMATPPVSGAWPQVDVQHGGGVAYSSHPYFLIALHASGNVLALGVVVLVFWVWGVLAAFQEPLLWAYLCSLSLRDVKGYLYDIARRELERK
jgi:hypothetical protein